MAVAEAKPKMASTKQGGKGRKKECAGFTASLGLAGWEHLESVLLASLISETPLLLIGPHGCAKSFFLEKLARALKLEYRFYNTSLINYDDLVGIPYPSDDRSQLEYISVPTAIWDAEVVFMDEISRARPHLQNKVFPIIHEKRIQGRDLDKLRYRWAAMNPPISEDSEDDAGYFGSEPLDTALADRFGFIVEVPSWQQLSQSARFAVLSDQFAGDHDFPVSLEELIGLGRKHYDTITKQRFYNVEYYLPILTDELAKQKIYLSTRRVTMLYANILSHHAVLLALAEIGGKKSQPRIEESVWTVLQHSLPQRAEGVFLDPARLRASHLQSWNLMEKSEEYAEAFLLRIADPCKRMEEALRCHKSLSEETLGNTLIHLLGTITDSYEAMACALAFYLTTRENIALPNTALAVLDPLLDPLFKSCHMDFDSEKSLRPMVKHIENLRERKRNKCHNQHLANLCSHVFREKRSDAAVKKMEKVFKEFYTRFSHAMNGKNQK